MSDERLRECRTSRIISLMAGIVAFELDERETLLRGFGRESSPKAGLVVCYFLTRWVGWQLEGLNFHYGEEVARAVLLLLSVFFIFQDSHTHSCIYERATACTLRKNSLK